MTFFFTQPEEISPAGSAEKVVSVTTQVKDSTQYTTTNYATATPATNDSSTQKIAGTTPTTETKLVHRTSKTSVTPTIQKEVMLFVTILPNLNKWVFSMFLSCIKDANCLDFFVNFGIFHHYFSVFFGKKVIGDLTNNSFIECPLRYLWYYKKLNT